ncbi:xylanase [Coprinopsis cinerea okayama7|uniref:Endo-1,4-beta-xylanase n=1 Tax=Coprinopsis cinerea (strain Okayama-7 / 130 / ATCC MYA-4618 / FGSC 9003) TaxID=240176 RepID=A8NW94_COPC7|nr:xylanase [Coprinopsis cinerea okayama7\|eukprot:XP_001836864.1 xylanase [Coprinopsis cinerea okayama7\
MKFSFVVFASVVTCALATDPSPSSSSHIASSNSRINSANVGTPNSEGEHDGYFYHWWSDTGATANYTNEAGGRYTIDWWVNGAFLGGKGWKPGSPDRAFNYTGTYEPSGHSLVTFTGWTRNPLVQYYIVESFGVLNPASHALRRGEVTCNGARYDVSHTWRYNQPSIDGEVTTFQQFWAVRIPRRVPGEMRGRIEFGCFGEAWRSLGMEMGEQVWQIMAVEGHFSRGRASFEVV